MHVNETKVNANTFVKDLKEQGGYATGMFGKYMNIMPPEVRVQYVQYVQYVCDLHRRLTHFSLDSYILNTTQ
jgi:hypothetical protein